MRTSRSSTPASGRTRTSTSRAATTAPARTGRPGPTTTATARTWRARSGRSTTTYGVVGVAPGARVWGVKILNGDGYGYLSWYVCGLDWILAQRDGSRPLFEAVNMSVAKSGADDAELRLQQQRHPAPGHLPARGRRRDRGRGRGQRQRAVPASGCPPPTTRSSRCRPWPTWTASPAGSVASAATRGAATTRTTRSRTSATTATTSTSSRRASASGRPSPGRPTATRRAPRWRRPTVTGAVALYKASRPLATPAQVKEALQYLGTLDWKTSTDPDSKHEKLLDVSRLGPARHVQHRGHATGRGRRGRWRGDRAAHRRTQRDLLRARQPRDRVVALGVDRRARHDEPARLDRDGDDAPARRSRTRPAPAPTT